ncbi:MAG: hypothetical protein WKF35_08125 [Ferruginibacter sp.]
MKKNILYAAAGLAAGVAYYIVSKKKSGRKQDYTTPPIKSHHVTDVFARAKEQAVK